jgi:hypothetical protein
MCSSTPRSDSTPAVSTGQSVDFLPVGWGDIVVPRSIDRWDYAHHMRNVRLAGLLAGLGYLGVLAGTVAWIVAFHAIDESLVFELTTTAG